MEVPLTTAEPSLATRLERLPGVGTARAERLARLGLMTVRDALMHFPRDYKDFSGAHRIADLAETEHASIAGTVTDVAARTTVHGRAMLTVTLDAAGGRLKAVWFNMPFMARRFEGGCGWYSLASRGQGGRGGSLPIRKFVG